MNIRDAIREVTSGNHLTMEQASHVFGEIMEGRATDAQIAALLIGLKMNGENADEIAGAARTMREKAMAVIPATSQYLVDTCGTGGDCSNTFNISTAAAFIAAGAGATVAKHGNRSVSSGCGSADVLEALGVKIGVTPDIMKRCLDELGICFLFAPSLHTAMKYAMNARRETGVRTIFNILGPLTNPSKAPAQVLGVFSQQLTETLARVLNSLGSRKAYVVHGGDGLDEITITGPTMVAELSEGKVRVDTVSPENFGMSRSTAASIKGGAPAENAAIITAVLGGQKGPCRDIAVLNAAFALAASGVAPTPLDGVRLAESAIDSGAARRKLEGLVNLTNA